MPSNWILDLTVPKSSRLLTAGFINGKLRVDTPEVSDTTVGLFSEHMSDKIRTHFAQLVTDDKAETILAVFHKSHGGLFSKARPAALDITPEGMHIIDDIVTTFVWFEHRGEKVPITMRDLRLAGRCIAVLSAPALSYGRMSSAHQSLALYFRSFFL